MPYYHVEGIGKQSRRKRSRTYFAANEAQARIQADADETEILKIDELLPKPEHPASDRQKKYATDLGIAFDPNIGSQSISDLISKELGAQPGRQDELVRIALKGKTIFIQYKPYGEQPTERLIEPYHLVNTRGDHVAVLSKQIHPNPGKEKCRSFRIDRIVGLVEASMESHNPKRIRLNGQRVLSWEQSERLRLKYEAEDASYLIASVICFGLVCFLIYAILKFFVF